MVGLCDLGCARQNEITCCNQSQVYATQGDAIGQPTRDRLLLLDDRIIQMHIAAPSFKHETQTRQINGRLFIRHDCLCLLNLPSIAQLDASAGIKRERTGTRLGDSRLDEDIVAGL